MSDPPYGDQAKRKQQQCEEENILKLHLKALINPLRSFISSHNYQANNQQRNQKSNQYIFSRNIMHRISSRKCATHPVL